MLFDTFPIQLLFEHQISFSKMNIFYRIFFSACGVLYVWGFFPNVFENVDETMKE